MKRVTLTFTMDFPTHYPDSDCFMSAMEVQSQGEWNDDSMKIEVLPGEPE